MQVVHESFDSQDLPDETHAEYEPAAEEEGESRSPAETTAGNMRNALAGNEEEGNRDEDLEDEEDSDQEQLTSRTGYDTTPMRDVSGTPRPAKTADPTRGRQQMSNPHNYSAPPPYRTVGDGLAALQRCGISRDIIDAYRTETERYLKTDLFHYSQIKQRLKKQPLFKELSGNEQKMVLEEGWRRKMQQRISQAMDAESRLRALVNADATKLPGTGPRSLSAAHRRDMAVVDAYSASMKRAYKLVSAEGMGTLPLPADIEKEALVVCDNIWNDSCFDRAFDDIPTGYKRKADGPWGNIYGHEESKRRRLSSNSII